LKQLTPLLKGASGEPMDLLREEIDRLKHENLSLRSTLKSAESDSEKFAKEKSILLDSLEHERRKSIDLQPIEIIVKLHDYFL